MNRGPAVRFRERTIKETDNLIVAAKTMNPDMSLSELAERFGYSKARVSEALIRAGMRTNRERKKS